MCYHLAKTLLLLSKHLTMQEADSQPSNIQALPLIYYPPCAACVSALTPRFRELLTIRNDLTKDIDSSYFRLQRFWKDRRAHREQLVLPVLLGLNLLSIIFCALWLTV